MKSHQRAGLEMIGDQPHKERRRQKRPANESGEMFPHRLVADQEKESCDHTQGDEGMDVKERHRSIETELDPERQDAAPLAVARGLVRPGEVFGPPVKEQK